MEGFSCPSGVLRIFLSQDTIRKSLVPRRYRRSLLVMRDWRSWGRGVRACVWDLSGRRYGRPGKISWCRSSYSVDPYQVCQFWSRGGHWMVGGSSGWKTVVLVLSSCFVWDTRNRALKQLGAWKSPWLWQHKSSRMRGCYVSGMPFRNRCLLGKWGA